MERREFKIIPENKEKWICEHFGSHDTSLARSTSDDKYSVQVENVVPPFVYDGERPENMSLLDAIKFVKANGGTISYMASVDNVCPHCKSTLTEMLIYPECKCEVCHKTFELK